MLVLRQNWTLARFERFLGDALTVALLGSATEDPR
jgi:hypothetical protein